ncbi:hypothetical protein [Luteimonas terrae]|uniref:Anthranilate/para-aminobenzoate synthase component II n=1 Tax=Luteimonas terrae TaxID=1530191 RepID=A0ABU1XX81_9GAMM|nr:hypothetical protein [Luteimonas terrae]MDR7193372.1 anthranilate/para-aminobenzoate synthase component II [Luteimonas terrae]
MNTLESNTHSTPGNVCGNVGLTARTRAAGGDLNVARMVLHAEIAALSNARTCAMQGDATTIYARIHDLIIDRQSALQHLQRDGGL